MAITSVSLTVPSDLQSGEVGQVIVSITNDASTGAVTLTGIKVVDLLNVFKVGDFSSGLPAKDSFHFGNQAVNPVPDWGTEYQSMLTAPDKYGNQYNLLYPYNNEVDSTAVNSLTTGSFSGGPIEGDILFDGLDDASITLVPDSTYIYRTTMVSTGLRGFPEDVSQLDPSLALFGRLQASVTVEGSNKEFFSGTEETSLFTSRATGISLVVVGTQAAQGVLIGSSPNIIDLFQFARSPLYAPPEWAGGSASGFDFQVRTMLNFEDGSSVDVTEQCTYASNDLNRMIVVANGPYGVQDSSTVGGNPLVTGGAGAVTLLPENAGQYEPAPVEITSTFQTFSETITLGFVDKLPVKFWTKPTSILNASTGAGQYFYADPYITYESGEEELLTGGGIVLQEFVNNGDGILSWYDQDYAQFQVDLNVDALVTIKTTFIDPSYPFFFNLKPIITPVRVNKI